MSGFIEHPRPVFTGTYTVNANCTLKEVDTDVNGNVFHFDEFLGPNGNNATTIETDPGVVAAGTETRDSEPGH
jgi:hypothetical protein